MRVALRAFAAALPVHFVWEMAQMDLFLGIPTGFWASMPHCGLASVGDAVLTLLVLAAGAIVFGTVAWMKRPGWRPWLVVGGLSVAVAVATDWMLVHGLKRWSYAPAMPRIPGLDVGLTPVLQMLLLTPAILWWASRDAPRAASAR